MRFLFSLNKSTMVIHGRKGDECVGQNNYFLKSTINKQVMASGDDTYGRIFLHMQASGEGSSLGIFFGCWFRFKSSKTQVALLHIPIYILVKFNLSASYPKFSNTTIIIYSRQGEDNPRNLKRNMKSHFILT